MKWRFQYRRREILGAIIRIFRPVIAFVGIPYLGCLVSFLYFSGSRTGRFPTSYLIGGIICGTMVTALIWNQYRLMMREMEDVEERELRLEENGIVLSSVAGRSWFSYGKIVKLRVKGSCLWVISENKLVLLVPKRIFSGKEEQKRVIRTILDRMAAAKRLSECETATVQQEEQKKLQEEYPELSGQADWRILCGWNDGGAEQVLAQAKICHLRVARMPRKDPRTGARLVWEIVCTENHVYLKEELNLSVYRWEEFQLLAETPDFFFLCGIKKKIGLYFRKSAVEGTENQERFRRYCREHGLEYVDYTEKISQQSGRQKKRRLLSSKKARILFVILCSAGAVLVYELREQAGDSGSPDRQAGTEDVGYGSPDRRAGAEGVGYCSLDRQAEVLRSLGFEISEELIDQEREWMETLPEAREWIEGRPYVTLLMDLGIPTWDEETWEITEYSDQAYWFDWEGFDLGSDYLQLLGGINAMAQGEVVFSEMETDLEQVDWEQGDGTVVLNFCANGTPYEIRLQADYDWLDPAVIEEINQILKKEQTSGRIYAMDDQGQGCILFYRDEAWAKKFRKKTGIPLHRNN